jgi:hypothetical protein
MAYPEQKSDYLKECMTDPALIDRTVPIDQFCQAYCVVCAYKPCVRSRANQMIFTERVANWKLRMFTNVPRASESDENYATIRAKNFQTVEESLVIGTHQEQAKTPEQPPEMPIHFTPIESTTTPAEIPPSPASPSPMPPVITRPANAPRQQPTLNNTPFQGGVILPGKPVDKDQDQKIDVGGTFTFGDDE